MVVISRSVGTSRLILATLMVLAMGAISVTFGLSLEDAKSQGLVGEQPNGYLGAVRSPPHPDTLQLVKSVNQQRREIYQEIAARNNTSVEAVELLAGKTAINKTLPGHYIQLPSGDWVTK